MQAERIWLLFPFQSYMFLLTGFSRVLFNIPDFKKRKLSAKLEGEVDHLGIRHVQRKGGSLSQRGAGLHLLVAMTCLYP